MKLALATLSLAFASAQASSLRAKQAVDNTDLNPIDEKLLTSEIVLQGTTGEPTSEDFEFIAKALVSSYNDVHWEVGHLMNSPNAIDLKGSGIADASSVFEVATPIQLRRWKFPAWWKYRGFYIPSPLCRHCPDDDAMGGVLDSQSLLMTPISEDCAGLCNDKATAELEVNFCDRIKSSQGSTYLSSTTACTISFDVQEENEEDNEEAKDKNTEEEEETHEEDPVATLDTTIILKGIGAGESTQEEHAILAKAFVAAYNDVHWKENHYLDDADIPFIAASETEATSPFSNTLVLDIVSPVQLRRWKFPAWWKYRGFYIPSPLCRHCPDDDAMGTANMEFDVQTIPSNAFDKEAIEVAFCRKIQNSSSDKLASTESCSIAVETLLEEDSKSVVG